MEPGRVLAEPVTDHLEGLYYEQLKKAVFESKTGELIKYKRKIKEKSRICPFQRIEDEIIKNSTHSILDSVIYVVKFGAEDWDGHGGRMAARAQFANNQFANWSFKDLYD